VTGLAIHHHLATGGLVYAPSTPQALVVAIDSAGRVEEATFNVNSAGPPSNWTLVAGVPTAIDVASTDGVAAACAVASMGSVWCWGGALAPRPMIGLANIVQIAASSGDYYALAADGTVFLFSVVVTTDATGSLAATDFSSATAVANLPPTRNVGAGYAVLLDGTVQMLPRNPAPSPSTYPETYQPPPPAMTGAIEVFAGNGNGPVCALRADSSAICWGDFSPRYYFYWPDGAIDGGWPADDAGAIAGGAEAWEIANVKQIASWHDMNLFLHYELLVATTSQQLVEIGGMVFGADGGVLANSVAEVAADNGVFCYTSLGGDPVGSVACSTR
jgi:hypothetical protein